METTYERIGILLANAGSPSAPTPEAVGDYLKAYLSHKRLAPFNSVLWWVFLRLFVLPKQRETVARKYKKIWTPQGSPLLVYHTNLAAKLQEAYKTSGKEVLVKNGMSFGEPSIDRALQQFRKEGVSRLIILPLYPQNAFSTTKVVEDKVRESLKDMGWRPFVRYVSSYSDNEVYRKAIAASVLAAGFRVDSRDKLVFSCRSIPLKDIEAGDTYELQVNASCLAIAEELGLDRTRWTLGYQSRFDKVRQWLSPLTSAVFDRVVQGNAENAYVVCPNFAVDCRATLYGFHYELEPAFNLAKRRAGMTNDPMSLIYVPCLNDTDEHVKVLQSVVSRLLQ